MSFEAQLPARALFTPAEAAPYLGMDARKVARLCRQGAIPARKLGGWQIARQTLIDLAEGREPAAPAYYPYLLNAN